MLGAIVSRTVIVKLQFVPLADVHGTVFVPFGKNEPEGGEQFTAPQFPLVLGKKVTGWQVLPADDPDFEEAALRACELIVAGDPRIGKVPARKQKPKGPKK